jgi:hypothetical protein
MAPHYPCYGTGYESTMPPLPTDYYPKDYWNREIKTCTIRKAPAISLVGQRPESFRLPLAIQPKIPVNRKVRRSVFTQG